MYSEKNRYYAGQYLLVVITGFFALSAMLLSDSIPVHITAMLVLCAAGIVISRFDLLHPYFWFSAGFTLYSISYAVLCAMGVTFEGYSRENLLYPAVALLIVLLIVSPAKQASLVHNDKALQVTNFAPYACRALFIAVVICDLYLAGTGFLSKSQLKQQGNLFFKMGLYFVRYISMFELIRLSYSLSHGEKLYAKQRLEVLAYGLSVVLFGLFTGERDVYIRFIVIIGLVLFYFGKLKKKHFIILVPAFVALMSLSVVFKYYFSKGAMNSSSESILVQFLQSDFSAAGRNLQYLLERPWTKGSQGYKILITDFLSPFFPGRTFFNADTWFNHEVHTGAFKGYAFTLVGTGYIMGGLPGVAAVFSVIGLLVRILYRKANNSAYHLAAYVYMITTITFAFRESMHTVWSSLFRVVLLSILASRYLYFGSPKK